jgi:hypothetical protein
LSEDWQGKPKNSEKTCLRATLSTTNTIRLDTGANQGRRGGKPATNHLSYGAAFENTNSVLTPNMDLKWKDVIVKLHFLEKEKLIFTVVGLRYGKSKSVPVLN